MPPLWIDSRPASPAGSRLSIRISAVERYPRNFDSSYPQGVDIWISGLCHSRESGNPVRASDARVRGHDKVNYSRLYGDIFVIHIHSLWTCGQPCIPTLHGRALILSLSKDPAIQSARVRGLG